MVTLISRLICRKLTLNHLNYTVYSFQSISISPVSFSLTPSQRTTGRYSIFKFDFLCPIHSLFRSFSSSSSHTSSSSKCSGTSVSREKSDFKETSRGMNDKFRLSRRNFKHEVDYPKQNVEMEKIIQIVELIKRDESDMESKLNLMDVTLSHILISKIFQLLNCDGFSGLRFFSWVSETQIDFKRNSEFCSLIIDNLGRIKDYDSMLFVLKDFSRKGICITEKAFAFLPVSSSDGFEVRINVKKAIVTLNKAGGSSRNSGIYGLIKMLCTLNYFNLAVFVMEETARKPSYYNVLIWAKCRGSKFQEAQELFDNMRRFGCEPNANSFNYLLGSLCKNGRIAEACHLLEVMNILGYLPDAITFEIFIYHAYRNGRLDFAVDLLDQMLYRGLEPRLTTHAAFIKGYFYSNRFQEAYKYVIDMAVKYKCHGNMNYSLLASLHQRKGMLLESREILVDMIEKGLKPNFPVYIKVLKDLHKSGMGHLAADLKSRFSKFNSSTKAE